MSKLSEFESLLRSVNRGGYHRCSICNCVSNDSIETEIGDYKPHQSFTNDPNNGLHFICIDCADVINDQRYDYELMDEGD